MPGPANFPLRTRMTDANGVLTRPWIGALQALENPTPNPAGVLAPAAGTAIIDLGLSLKFYLTLNGTAVTIAKPTFTGGTIDPTLDLYFDLYLLQDVSGLRAGPTYATGPGGFVSNTAALITIDGTTVTMTAIRFRFHTFGLWAPDSSFSGLQTS
jgi:hypothetical protein